MLKGFLGTAEQIHGSISTVIWMPDNVSYNVRTANSIDKILTVRHSRTCYTPQTWQAVKEEQ